MSIQEIEKAIADLGEGTPEYHEAMAFYLMTMARAQWRAADRARESKSKRGRREEALKAFSESELVK